MASVDEILEIRQNFIRSDTENFLQQWENWFEKIQYFLLNPASKMSRKRLAAGILEELIMECSKIPSVSRDFSTKKLIPLMEFFLEIPEEFQEKFQCMKTCIFLFPKAVGQRFNQISAYFTKIFQICDENFLEDAIETFVSLLIFSGQNQQKFEENWKKNFESSLNKSHAIFTKLFDSRCVEFSKFPVEFPVGTEFPAGSSDSSHFLNLKSTKDGIKQGKFWLLVAIKILELPVKNSVPIGVKFVLHVAECVQKESQNSALSGEMLDEIHSTILRLITVEIQKLFKMIMKMIKNDHLRKSLCNF